MEAINAKIDEMATTPGSGVKMCHDQGKTAIYLSPDGKDIVTHEPAGGITKEPFVPRTSRER